MDGWLVRPAIQFNSRPSQHNTKSNTIQYKTIQALVHCMAAGTSPPTAGPSAYILPCPGLDAAGPGGRVAPQAAPWRGVDDLRQRGAAGEWAGEGCDAEGGALHAGHDHRHLRVAVPPARPRPALRARTPGRERGTHSREASKRRCTAIADGCRACTITIRLPPMLDYLTS